MKTPESDQALAAYNDRNEALIDKRKSEGSACCGHGGREAVTNGVFWCVSSRTQSECNSHTGLQLDAVTALMHHLFVQVITLEPFCLMGFGGVCQAGLQPLVYISQGLHLQECTL